MKKNDWAQVLVFTRTKHGANRLAAQLQKDGINADAIHGNKSQNARTRALEDFKDGKVQVLVATDIAARGLDIEDLPHVVNFDLPHVPEDYVHRIGRTGRAGATGEALSLVCGEDRPLLAAIEKLINRKIEVRAVEGFEAGTRAAAASGRRKRRAPRRPRGGRLGEANAASAGARENAARIARRATRASARRPGTRAIRAAWTSTSPTSRRHRRRPLPPPPRSIPAVARSSRSRRCSARRRPDRGGAQGE